MIIRERSLNPGHVGLLVLDGPCKTEDAMVILAAASNSTSLSIVNRTNCNTILEALNMQLLESLTLYNCCEIKPGVLDTLLHDCKQLSELSLDRTCVREPEFYISIGQKIPNLTKIDFGDAADFSGESLANMYENYHDVSADVMFKAAVPFYQIVHFISDETMSIF